MWNLIETAPKDGSLIVVIQKGEREDKQLPYFPSIAYWNGVSWQDADDDEEYVGWDITHWIPLPQ